MAGFSQQQLDEHEQTRQGKNLCECGTPKEMYYKPWCPRCEKPQLVAITAINFIQALRHIAVITGDEDVLEEGSTWKVAKKGYKQRMWDLFMDIDDFRNDATIQWDFFEMYCTEEEDELTPEQRADVDLFRKTFGLEDADHIFLDISW